MIRKFCVYTTQLFFFIFRLYPLKSILNLLTIIYFFNFINFLSNTIVLVSKNFLKKFANLYFYNNKLPFFIIYTNYFYLVKCKNFFFSTLRAIFLVSCILTSHFFPVLLLYLVSLVFKNYVLLLYLPFSICYIFFFLSNKHFFRKYVKNIISPLNYYITFLPELITYY